MKLRSPPKIKVLEALGAIVDGRIKQVGEGDYVVVSSDGYRKYSVHVDLERGIADSTDNGTTYKGYMGYPIISVLMLKGVLPYNSKIANALKGIKWKELNDKYKRYEIVMEIVKNAARRGGVEPYEVDAYVEDIMKRLEGIRLSTGDGRKREEAGPRGGKQ
ncbi:hypothetical protein [Thermocladium modestius]|uniref:hypothetical protein n=1 Tax=Thermocladium modestius TaxID=62609 RepID=UPI001E430966|nr:hypothetical protein [Thermocladium modestius]